MGQIFNINAKKIESQFSLLHDQLSHRAFQALPDRTLRQRLYPHQKHPHKKFDFSLRNLLNLTKELFCILDV